MTSGSMLQPEEHVLSTMNRDGSRRWLSPHVSSGPFWKWRRVAAYGLILLFTVLPWIKINGKQAFLLDLPAREFTIFGATFLPTDTILLMLFMASVFVLIFFVTTLFGRVWCGWACPQTVYMEFLFRPIERFFDGAPDARGRVKRKKSGARTVAKYLTFLGASLFLAHVFLAYFVGVEELFRWMRQSPFEHPKAFFIVMFVTGAMMLDFGFFREQICILCCPYGRFQSVMLDRESMIVSYDRNRGEPRGRAKKAKNGDVELPVVGDCVDCSMCVTTCPTGIDIRDGLQLECIGCAQCIDACNTVMTKLKRPKGLIRYSSQARMEDGKRHLLRPRVIIYPILLLAFIGAFAGLVSNQRPVDVTVLRGQARPYIELPSGEIQNEVRVKLVNRTREVATYDISLEGFGDVRMEPVGDATHDAVDPRETVTAHYRVIVQPDIFKIGRAEGFIIVNDGNGYERRVRYRMQGPWSSSSTPTTAQDAAGDEPAVEDES
ncbi:MAG: cytochrome c oxidase accessory protein CcoG [Planctomycetota bacterium]